MSAFSTTMHAAPRRDELTRIIEGWLHDMADDGAALDILQRARVPCAPILSVADAMRHPHLIERGTVSTAVDPVLGDVKMPGSLLRFAGYAAASIGPAPFLGEHNARVLAEWLDMPADAAHALEASGILVCEPGRPEGP